MKIRSDDLAAAAGDASELLKSLANRHRLLILCRLTDGEHSVGELAESLGVRDSTVSQHLALLRKDGLVASRREGQTVWYTIASPPARAIIETLHQVYCAPAPICAPPARPAGADTP